MRSASVDPASGEQPSIARIYDYVLGGSANFPVDRCMARTLLDAFPGERDYAHINRDLLRRVIVELGRTGIAQFLDLGSGIPSPGSVHEIAHRANAEARVAYVDIDPVAVHHARALLDGDRRVTVTQADIREPEVLLAAPGIAGFLDLSRPVAVLAIGILDILDAPDPRALLATYRDACVPGSALAISNGARMAATDGEWEAFRAILAQTPTPTLHDRDADQVRALFEGYELVDPGVVPSAAWRPERPVSGEQAARSNAWGAVGVKR